jgi:hypothetical protein
MARQCRDASNESYCLYIKAMVTYELGEPGEARRLCTQAIAAFDASGDEIGYATALMILAEIEFADAHPEPALHLAVEARDILLRGEDARSTTHVSSNLAAYSVALDDYRGARRFAEDALRWARRGGLEEEVAYALQHLALLWSLDNQARRAAKLFGYVEAQLNANGAKRQWTEQWACDKLVSALRAKLSDAEIDELSAIGAEWSEEQALQEALAETQE